MFGLSSDMIFDARTGMLYQVGQQKQKKKQVPHRPKKKASPVDPLSTLEEKMAFHASIYFQSRMRELHIRSGRKVSANTIKTQKNWDTFLTVVRLAKHVSMSPADFIEAQIWWLSRYSKSTITTFHLVKNHSDACQRGLSWKRQYQNQRHLYKAPKAKVEFSEQEELQHYEKVLKQTMQAWGISEAEVYKRFGEELFHPQFLHTRPAWKVLNTEAVM